MQRLTREIVSHAGHCTDLSDPRPDLWLKDFPVAHDPEGKTLGIVGMGGIGSVSLYCSRLQVSWPVIAPSPQFFRSPLGI